MPIDLFAAQPPEPGADTTAPTRTPTDLFAQHPEWAPKDLLDVPEEPQKPWYEADINLPDFIDQDKWNKTMTDLEQNWGKTAKTLGKAATNPIAVLEGVTDFVQKIPGFFGGVAGGVGRLAVELGKGNTNMNDLYGAFSETFDEASQGINEYTRIYKPSYPEEAAVLERLAMSPAEMVSTVAHGVAESEAVEELPKDVRDQVKGLFKFAGDAGGLILQGKLMHNMRLKGEEPLADIPAAEALDATYAKDLVRQRIAQERAATPQRPLERLSRMEKTLEAERPSPERVARQAELEQTFKDLLPEEPVVEPATPTEVPSAETVRSPETQIRQEQGGQDLRGQGQVQEGPVPTGQEAAPQVERRQTIAGPGGETGFVERRSSTLPRETPERRQAVAQEATVPEFARTDDAISFGESASPEQLARMQTMLDDSRAKSQTLRESARDIQDPAQRMQVQQAGMDEATRGQFLREALEASRGEHPAQAKLRPVGDILKDVNTALGKKGAVGDVGGMSPDQLAAYERLTKDYLVIRRNAKRLGKEVGEYLKGLKVDPAVADAMQRNADALLAHASAIYGAQMVQRYDDAATLKPREGKYAGSVNLDKQDISASAKQFEMAQAAAHPKTTITWDETGAKAAKAMLNPKSAEAAFNRMRRLTEGQLTQDVEVVRQVNSATQQLFGDLFDQFKKGEITQDEFNAGMANYNEQVFRTTSDISSELGRALNSLKKTATGERIPRIVGGYQKLNPRQKGLVDAVTQKWRKGTLTPEDIATFEKYMPNPKWSDYLKQLWYEWILSGPVTHVRNVMGNSMWMMAQPGFRAIAGMVDPLWSTVSRAKRTRYLSEVGPLLAGYRRGFPRGAMRAKDMFRKGYIPGAETKWEMEMGTASSAFERSPHAILRKVAPAFTNFTRALHAMDVWSKAMAYDGQMSALARRAANQKGLRGAERYTFERDYIANPPDSALESAKRFADNATFMDHPDPFTSGIITLRNIPVIGTGLRYTVIPFVNTIGNLLKRGMEMTPGVGLLKEAASYGMRQGIRKMPAGRTKALGKEWAESRQYNVPDIAAKQATGLMLTMYILNKAAQGRVTGPMPENPAEREFWYRNNIQPWSVRYGGTDSPEGLQNVTDGTWVSYRWAEPFNTPMAAAAQFYDRVLKEPGGVADAEKWMEWSGDMWANLIDGAYFSGLQRFLDKYSRKSELLPRFAAGWVPYSGLMRTVARTYEAATEGQVKVRDANPWAKAFTQVIPGLAEYAEIPAKLTVYGEEAVLPGGVLQQWMPIKWAKMEPDAVEQSLMQAGMYPSLPAKTIRHAGKLYNIPEATYRDFAIDYGSQLKSTFARLVDNPRWPSLKPEQQFDMLNSRMSTVRDMARKRLRAYMYRNGMLNADNEVKKER